MESMNLVTAQITFTDSHLALVHIPNDYYHFFTSAIFRVLFNDDYGDDSGSIGWTNRHDFLNLSITPVGCSLFAPTHLVDRYFRPAAKQFNNLVHQSKTKRPTVEISNDEFLAIQVDGQGLDAAQRVLELTGPLAMAGISIFFTTTYFSDYILVPVQARHTVVKTLQQQGFVFSADAEAFISQLSPSVHHNFDHTAVRPDRPRTASSSGSEGQRPYASPAPTTPPAKDIPELQTRTFTKLAKNGIEPIIDASLKLVSCAGSGDNDTEGARNLKEALMQVLLASPRTGGHALESNESGKCASKTNGFHWIESARDYSASFLSVTLSSEPISIIMEERLLPVLGNTLFGSKGEDDILVPIIFDLRSLGWNATGIIGGVAGRLGQGALSQELEEDSGTKGPVEISFLSSAKAGSVIVQASQLRKAVEALEMGKQELKASK